MAKKNEFVEKNIEDRTIQKKTWQDSSNSNNGSSNSIKNQGFTDNSVDAKEALQLKEMADSSDEALQLQAWEDSINNDNSVAQLEDYEDEDYEDEDYEDEDYEDEDYEGEDYEGEDYEGEDYEGEDYEGEDYEDEENNELNRPVSDELTNEEIVYAVCDFDAYATAQTLQLELSDSISNSGLIRYLDIEPIHDLDSLINTADAYLKAMFIPGLASLAGIGAQRYDNQDPSLSKEDALNEIYSPDLEQWATTVQEKFWNQLDLINAKAEVGNLSLGCGILELLQLLAAVNVSGIESEIASLNTKIETIKQLIETIPEKIQKEADDEIRNAWIQLGADATLIAIGLALTGPAAPIFAVSGAIFSTGLSYYLETDGWDATANNATGAVAGVLDSDIHTQATKLGHVSSALSIALDGISVANAYSEGSDENVNQMIIQEVQRLFTELNGFINELSNEQSNLRSALGMLQRLSLAKQNAGAELTNAWSYLNAINTGFSEDNYFIDDIPQ
ncbi:MAG: hypothetical protein MK207_12905 [Saprospiraceae bacterium]|nr:hypothetical protein [Saprospiraceae bacterium]